MIKSVVYGLLLASIAMRVGYACDFTVRDIGFVRLGGPEYSLVVVGPTEVEFQASQIALMRAWDMTLVGSKHGAVPELQASLQSLLPNKAYEWSVWLVDSRGRSLLLEHASSQAALPGIEELVAKHVNTPRMKQLAEATLGSFAQLVLFDGDAASRVDEAREAAAALRELEPMLPRPVTLPVNVVVIPQEERVSERVLLWACEVDELPTDEAAMVVLYGRGCLAGPALLNESIALRNSIGQLALVGESCECETDRRWMEERRIPFYWTDEQSLLAEKSLGFNPGKSLVRSEVERVIARGSRNSRPTRAGDQIERIVSGYFESDIVPGEPEMLAIPPGKKNGTVTATVIAGAGWDFEPAEVEPPADESNAFDASISSPASPERASIPPKGGVDGWTATWILLSTLGLILFVSMKIRYARRS